MGGKSGGSSKTEVSEYRLSIHMGVCCPVDRITRISIDDKPMWSGSVGANTVIAIDQPNFFGGPKQDGGLSGEVHVLLGSDAQTLSPWLASKLTGLAGVPGFRGLTSLFFTGFSSPRLISGGGGIFSTYERYVNGRPGFHWSTNQPYVKPVDVTVQRTPRGISAQYAEFPDGTVNPAHVIYEAMTEPTLGMGAPASMFEMSTWLAAAQTLYNENFGIALAWVNQSSVEQITNDVQNHINGWVFQHPRTGRYHLKLVRNDYNPATLRTIDPDVAILSNFQRKGLGETVNEIVVTWTNPENEKEETIAVHDLGNLSAQGSMVSDSRNYYGVRRAALAAELGQRDIRVASAPLCACDAILNRKFWDIVPGDVIKLTWPEYGLNGLVMRVGKVDYGLPGNQAIKVNLVEDVFAIPVGAYVTPPATGWIDPSEDPKPIPSNMQLVVTLPTFFVANLMDVTSIEEPEVRAGVLVTQTGKDTFMYNLTSYLADASGKLGWQYLNQVPTVGYGTLTTAMIREPSTLVASLMPLHGATQVGVGSFIWIGSSTNFNEAAGIGSLRRSELCMITGYSSSGWTLMRGILDTQPIDWPVGTPYWVIDFDSTFDDISTIRSAGETAQYRAMPQTSKGTLPLAQATTFTGTLVNRPYFPARPANVKINGIPWGPTTEIQAGTDVTFTWSNRNRVTEVSQILAWDAASIAVETGQETVLELFDGNAQADASYKLRKINASASQVITYAELVGISQTGNAGWSLYSTRDGLTSFSRVSGLIKVPVMPQVYMLNASAVGIVVSGNSIVGKLADLTGARISTVALFAVVMHRGVLTPPPGWTLVVSAQNLNTSSTDQWTTVYRKNIVTMADSQANTTWTVSASNRIAFQSVAFDTNDAAARVAIAQSAIGVPSTTSVVSVPPLTATTDGECFLMAASFTNGSSASRTMTPPIGSTLISSASGVENRLGVAYQGRNAGQANGGTFVTSNTTGYATALTIRLTLSYPGYGVNYGNRYG